MRRQSSFSIWQSHTKDVSGPKHFITFRPLNAFLFSIDRIALASFEWNTAAYLLYHLDRPSDSVRKCPKKYRFKCIKSKYFNSEINHVTSACNTTSHTLSKKISQKDKYGKCKSIPSPKRGPCKHIFHAFCSPNRRHRCDKNVQLVTKIPTKWQHVRFREPNLYTDPCVIIHGSRRNRL